MIFDLGLINLILYCAQQLGIALGLGAQTIMLVAYVTAMRDRVIDDTEAQFLRATRNTLWVALLLTVISGVAISVLHVLAGQQATVFTPAYLFKSVLIAVVILLTASLHVLPETFAEGLLGGTWYALFLVHILAPVTTWANLLTLYIVWIIGFNLIWYVVAFSTREKKFAKPKVVSKPKPERKPLFGFLHHDAKVEAPEPLPTPMVAATPQPREPVQYQPIVLETRPIIEPLVTPQPVPVAAPIAAMPTMPVPPAPPMQQIKVDQPPIAMQPIEKMPASQTTDTPFLPQVPPLQPIPTIAPQPGTLPAVGASSQKPQDVQVAAPTVSPEIKLGLNVMPKSPDQLT